MKKNIINLITIFLLMICISGCNFFSIELSPSVEQKNSITEVVQAKDNEVHNPINIEPIQKTNSVYTVDRKVSLTFSGLPDAEKLEFVLNLLESYNIKATFFVPGMKVAEKPDLVEYILSRGHEVENNTLNKKDMNHLTYEQIFKEIELSKATIEKYTNHIVKYVRTEPVPDDSFILKAATESEHIRYVGYSFFLKDSLLDGQFTSPKDLRKYIQRGAIIAIDLDRNNKIAELLDLLVPAVQEVKYEFVTLDELIKSELPKKPYSEITGYDEVRSGSVKDVTNYNLFYKGNEHKKQIALTFDDWGTDYTVTTILDILKQKNVLATFFIRANGADANPSLARAIFEEGHEIANHTYSHPVITSIESKQIEEELIKAHYVITEAIQQPPSLIFRPPTGAFDEASIQTVVSTGYRNIAMYDVTALDWDISNSAEDIYNTVTSKATNGSIVLLHMLDDIHTIEALPKILDFFLERGYKFVTTTEIQR